MIKKPAIPAIQGITDRALLGLLRPMKENIELMTGVRDGVVAKLPENTTDLPTIVAKINEIIGKLNAHD
jgi:hypothetical protein